MKEKNDVFAAKQVPFFVSNHPRFQQIYLTLKEWGSGNSLERLETKRAKRYDRIRDCSYATVI